MSNGRRLMTTFQPKAYVKTTCPYSFKFRLFVTEAGLADQIEFVPMDPEASDFQSIKADVEARSGASLHFPTVEVEPNEFIDDSDRLIAHFSDLHGIDDSSLATLTFYREGLFPTFLELFALCASPLAWLIRLGRTPRAFK